MLMKTPNICLLTVGNEILIGQITDTNSAWLGDQLTSLGFSVREIISVADDESQIVSTLARLSKEYDIVIMTGGLGPTKDDITVQSIAKFLEVPLEFHKEVYERIEKIFAAIQKPMSPSHHQQCYLPKGVTLLFNSMGTAPGMFFQKDHFNLISLPGVPYEMKALFTEEVVPKVLQPKIGQHIFQETFMVSGLGETEIEDRIQPLIDRMPENYSVAYLPALGQVRVRLTAYATTLNDEAKKTFEFWKHEIRNSLGSFCFSAGDTNLETYLGILCLEKKISIATVESCTGGSIASRIAAIPGASAYFKGSIVCYTNEIKENLVYVPKETLTKYGAVSEETVIAMVKGGLKVSQADVVVSVSGIAGPTGGTETKPVGTVWMAVGNSNQIQTKLFKFTKKREQNILLSTQASLNFLRLFIEETFKNK